MFPKIEILRDINDIKILFILSSIYIIYFIEPQNITRCVEEGHELNITCRNRKVTSSSVLWTRNGIPVQKGKSNFLYIKSANRTHAGNYICVSLSPDGTHSSPITTVDVLCELLLYLDVVRTEWLLNKLLRMFKCNFLLICLVSHGTQNKLSQVCQQLQDELEILK